ncbi:MAG: hypothetical protein Salg2KO_07880 [Salibacteraceae bacterium]
MNGKVVYLWFMTITFHIGYAKTATTFAQQYLYPAMENIGYAGRYVGDKEKIKAARWAYELEELSESDIERVANDLKSQNHLNVLFSNEVLLRPHNIQKRLKVLKAFEKHADQVRIILSIRNPVDLIFSRYVHDITRGIFPRYSLKRALDFTGVRECLWPTCGNSTMNKILRKSPLRGGSCICNQHKVKTINVPYYELDSMKQLLDDVFSAEDIHYVITERLKSDFELEVSRLCAFLGSEISAERLADIQSVTHVNQRNKTPLYMELKKVNSDNGVLMNLKNHFNVHNERFMAQTGFTELAKLGYIA